MRAFFAHLRAELLGLLRVPGFLIPTLVFPSMFFLIFAAPYLKTWPAANQTTASFMTFAVFTVVFFQFGVAVAQERENPWYAYLRALPLAPWVRPAALVITGLLFALLAAAVVGGVAAATTPIQPERAAPLALFAALLMGAIPMGLFGVALAFLLSPRAALPVANLVYLPLSFLGGLWMPPEVLPGWAQKLSLYTPTRHWGELVWASAGGDPWPLRSALVLLAYTLAFALVAAWAWRRARA